MSGSKKIIAVMGATGFQGGAVIKAFKNLRNDEFLVRAITWNPSSERAQAIAPFVDEVVTADANDEELMVAAFDGCYGVFIMSDYWQDRDVRHEMTILCNCKETAKKAGVKHVVLSCLEDTRCFINKAKNRDSWKVLDKDLGMYVPHLDGKGEIAAEYATELPCTRLYTSAYFEIFTSMGMGPARQSDAEDYAITIPLSDKKLAVVAVEDIGKCVCAVFQDRSLIGAAVGVMSTAMTGQEMADAFTKICGLTVKYNAVPTEVFAGFGFPGADDLANMFRFDVEYEDEILKTRLIPQSIMSKMGSVVKFEDFLAANRHKFPRGGKMKSNDTACKQMSSPERVVRAARSA